MQYNISRLAGWRRGSVVASIAAGIVLAASGVTGTASNAVTPSNATRDLVHRADLPVGFQPEGIDTDTLAGRPYAFLGSMADGSIYRIDLRTGRGATLSGPADSAAIGVESDHNGRLYVADGLGGAVNGDSGAGARVIDERSGRVLANYRFSDAPALVNDVTLTPRAAYFTDTINPVIYELPFSPNGTLPSQSQVRTIPITGAYHFDDKASTIDGNGITPTPDGSALIVIQYRTGKLFRLDPTTGETRRVKTRGQLFPLGDGLTLDGRRLLIPQNSDKVSVLRLSADGTRGTLVSVLRDPSFDVPTNIARAGNRLYLPTSKLAVTHPHTAHYSVVSVLVPWS